ncbi:GtrA family protein [bacterium]|nr:GtrA family protein [bacterium]
MKLKELFINKSSSTAIQFFRYIFVGGGATVLHWGLLLFFREWVGLDANVANAIGFMGGLICNYLISTYWVFDASSIENKGVEFTAFAVIGVVGLGINQAIIWLFDKPLARMEFFESLLPADKYYIVGQVLATAVAFFWNFFARKYLLYNKKG